MAPCSCIGRPWRGRVQRLVLTDRFSNFIVMVLVVNAIVLALGETMRPPQTPVFWLVCCGGIGEKARTRPP